jgi:hypothetical protein
MTQQKELLCVYKATTKKGEVAHFGEYSAAKAWAGWGSVEQVPLKSLTLIAKPSKPCGACEALARTVMLDQTSHDTTPPQRTWVGLTDEEVENLCLAVGTEAIEVRLIEAKLKEKNT